MPFGMEAFLMSAREKWRKSWTSPLSERVALSKVSVTVFAAELTAMVLIPTVPALGPLMSLFSWARKGFFVEVVATQQRPKSDVEGKVMTIVPLAPISFESGSPNEWWM